VYDFNTFNGTPQNLIDSGSSVTFRLGGSINSRRHAMLLLRGTVPSNGVTLRSAQVLNGQSGTTGFNDSCSAANSSGTNVNQAPAPLSNRHWIVIDQAIPGNSIEPIAPSPFLWVANGNFPRCEGTTSTDCRYGRIFDDYLRAEFTMPSGRAFTRSAKIEVPGAPTVTMSNASIPAGVSRTLSQEP
jgi:hypothetical protein